MNNAEWLLSKGIHFSDLTWYYSPYRTHIWYHDQELGAADGCGTSGLLRWLDEERKEMDMIKVEDIQQIALTRTLAESEIDYPLCDILMRCVRDAAKDGSGYINSHCRLDVDTVNYLKRGGYRIFLDAEGVAYIAYDPRAASALADKMAEV